MSLYNAVCFSSRPYFSSPVEQEELCSLRGSPVGLKKLWQP